MMPPFEVISVAGEFAKPPERRYIFISDDPQDPLSWWGLWVNMWKQVASFWIVDLMCLVAAGFGEPYTDDPDRKEVRRVVPAIAWGGDARWAYNLADAYRPEGL